MHLRCVLSFGSQYVPAIVSLQYRTCFLGDHAHGDWVHHCLCVRLALCSPTGGVTEVLSWSQLGNCCKCTPQSWGCSCVAALIWWQLAGLQHGCWRCCRIARKAAPAWCYKGSGVLPPLCAGWALDPFIQWVQLSCLHVPPILLSCWHSIKIVLSHNNRLFCCSLSKASSRIHFLSSLWSERKTMHP